MVEGKVLDRMLRLWALAEQNASPHEAEIAMTRLRGMMADHHLSMSDIKDAAGAKHTRPTVVEAIAYTRKGRLAKYDTMIALAVGTLTTTKAFVITSHHGSTMYQTMRFIGSADDVEIASQLFHVFLRSARAYARLEYGRDTWNIKHSSFVMGFGHRLNERAKSWHAVVPQAQHQQYAMVLRSKTDAIDAYAKDHYNPTGKKSRKTDIDPVAAMMGIERANATDLGVSSKLKG